MVREGRVFISSATDPDFGAGYSVQVLEVGAQVTSGSSGNTITVRAGHGFAALDKFIVGTDTSQFKSILSVTATQLTLDVGQTCTVSAGDLLVNLAADTGSSIPLYDGAGLTVYSDMAYGSSVANNTVSTDANGRYRYYHNGINTWELVRTGSTPIALYTDTSGSGSSLDGVRYVNSYAVGSGTSSDPWLSWESAFSSIPTSGEHVIFPDGYYTQNSAISLPVNLTGWLRIKGNGGAIIKITSTNPGVFGIASHSDYDTLKYIHIEGLQINGNSVAGSLTNASPILIGPTTATASRLNYSNIVIRDITMTDLSDTGLISGISLGHAKVGGGDSATSHSDILIENIWQDGGRNGIVMTSDAETHTIQRVTIRNQYHKKLNIPTSASPGAGASGAGIQLGSYALVKDSLVDGCYWQNSVDVGIEVDNPYRVVVRDCVSVDALGIGFFATNFNTTIDVSQNEIVFDNPRVVVSAGTEDDANAYIGLDAEGGTSALAVGNAIVRNYSYTNLDNYVHHPLYTGGGKYTKRFEINGFRFASPNLVDPSGVTYIVNYWKNLYVGSLQIFRNGKIDLSMNAGGFAPLVRYFQPEITNGRIEFENVIFNATFTNAAGLPYFLAFDSNLEGAGANVVNGFIRGNQVTLTGGSAARSYGLNVRDQAASSSLLVENNDLSGLASGSIYLQSDPTDIATVFFQNNITSVQGYRSGVSIAVPSNVGTWVVNTATSGTDAACTNGTAYVGSVCVTETTTVTGIQYLVGSVGGTTKVVASIHKSAGTLIANSATAGTVVGTAAQLQQVPLFPTPFVLSPGVYFLALTFDSATAKFRTIPAYCNSGSGVIGNGVTQTFGTPATFTAPTTFTADKVPVASLY